MSIFIKTWLSIGIAALLMCWAFAGEARAQTTIVADDTGWYDNTGEHTASNVGYIVGNCGELIACGASRPEVRDFFVFDLSSVTGTIIAAELQLVNPSGGFSSGDASEDYDVFDVSTSIATLLAGGSGLTGIYADLGTGTTYGGKTVSSADNGTTVVVPLNAAFVSAANATSGQIAVGGAITTLDGDTSNIEIMFGAAGGPSNTQLVLTIEGEEVPALSLPGVVLFLLLALVAIPVIRQLRARTTSS